MTHQEVVKVWNEGYQTAIRDAANVLNQYVASLEKHTQISELSRIAARESLRRVRTLEYRANEIAACEPNPEESKGETK